LAAAHLRVSHREPQHTQRGSTVAASNINRVVITGNLTRDPELRALPSGTSVCELRVACNTRRKNGSTGEWEDKPNYFNVKVWGPQGESCSRFLTKGRPVAIDGRLEWREWETPEGQKRQAIDIIADSVQFLGSREEGSGSGFVGSGAARGGDVPVDERDFEPSPVGSVADEDIPF
jgi:single-strand DNA-binding protein